MRTVVNLVSVFQAGTAIAAAMVVMGVIVDEGGLSFRARTLVNASICSMLVASAAIALHRVKARFTPRYADREPLRLSSFGLSERERTSVLGIIAGKSMKELAIEQGVAPTTVRCALRVAYKKLHVSGYAELYALGTKYYVE
jgi:DNA-binding CsgD family transcriptional regulator